MINSFCVRPGEPEPPVAATLLVGIFCCGYCFLITGVRLPGERLFGVWFSSLYGDTLLAFLALEKPVEDLMLDLISSCLDLLFATILFMPVLSPVRILSMMIFSTHLSLSFEVLAANTNRLSALYQSACLFFQVAAS